MGLFYFTVLACIHICSLKTYAIINPHHKQIDQIPTQIKTHSKHITPKAVAQPIPHLSHHDTFAQMQFLEILSKMTNVYERALRDHPPFKNASRKSSKELAPWNSRACVNAVPTGRIIIIPLFITRRVRARTFPGAFLSSPRDDSSLIIRARAQPGCKSAITIS